MNNRSSTLLVVLIACATPLLLRSHADGPDGDGSQNSDSLKSTLDAYRKYAEIAPFLSCKYKMNHGDAKSIEEAVSGKFHLRASVKCLWLVDGSRALLRMEADPNEVAKLRGLPEYRIVPKRKNEASF